MATITNTVRWATNVDELKRNLREGLDQIEATRAGAEKLVQSLGGDKLIAAAHRYAAAVQEIGGVAKLTTAEQARVNTVVEKAIEKYEALGTRAPKALYELADATQQAERNTGGLTGAFGQLFAAFEASSIVNRLVSAVFDFGRQAVTTAGTLVDLSNKTGLSTETIQRMQFVAKQSGTDMTVFADAAFKMGVNVSEGTKKARDGAEALGLSWKDLRAASPDAQFEMVVQALERMEDPQKRNEAAVALFGKTAKEILPAIVDGYTKVAKEATVAGDAQVRALDAAGDAWDRWKQRTTTGFINVLGSMALLREASAGLTDDEKTFVLQTLQGEKSIEAYDAALIRFYLAKQKAKDIPLTADTIPSSYVADLKAAQAGWAALTATERDEVFTALQLGKSHDEIVNKLNITEEVLAVGRKAYEAHQEAIRKAGSEAEKYAQSLANLGTIGSSTDQTLASLDGTVVEGLKYYLAQGASVEDLARVYGLLVPQVEAAKRALKDEGDALKELQKIRGVEAGIRIDPSQLAHFGEVVAPVSPSQKGLADAQQKYSLEARDLRMKATLDAYTYEQVKLGEWVRDQKKALDGFEGDHAAAYAAIDADAQARFADLTRAHQQALAEMAEQEQTWSKGFSGLLSGIPSLLAQSFTGGGGLAGFGQAMTSGIGALGGSLLTKPLTGLFNKAAPALLNHFGMTLTTAIGGAVPFIGPAIGALAPVVIGGFKKLFGGVSEEEKKGRETVKAFEAQIASTLTATQKAEAGGEAWKMTAIGVRDAYLATGHSAAEADAAVNRLWASSKKSEAEQKAAAQAITDVMDLQKKAAEALPGILKDVTGGMNAISKGTVGAVNEAAAAIDKTKEGSTEAFTKIRESGAEEFDRTGRLAVSAFNAAIAGGKSFGEAMDDLGATFDDLTKAQGTFGFTTTASLQDLLNFKAFASGPGKEVMSTLDGVNKMMGGLQKLGLLTQDDFNDLAGIATDTFHKMTAGGVSGTQAMRAMQPTLQKLWELHHDQGLEIDENTGKLLTEAEQQGLVGDKMREPQERMLEVLQAIAKALGADLPDAAEKGAKGVKDAIDKVPTHVGVEFVGTLTPPDTAAPAPAEAPSYAARGGVVMRTGVQYFAAGGPVGTDTVPAWLTPGEGVVTAAAMRALGGAAALGVLNHAGVSAVASMDQLTGAARVALGSLVKQVDVLVVKTGKAAPGAFTVLAEAATDASGEMEDALRRQALTAFEDLSAQAETKTPEALQTLTETMKGASGDIDADVGKVQRGLKTTFDEFGRRVKDGAGTMTDEINKIPRHLDIGIDYTASPIPPPAPAPTPPATTPVPTEDGGNAYASLGGLVTAFGIQHFDLGGIVKAWRLPMFRPIGNDTVPAMLTPGELILNEPQQSKIADLLAAGAEAAKGLLAGGKQGPAVVLQEKFEFSFDLRTIDGSDLQQTVETKLMPQIVSVIEDRRRGYTARLQQALGTT